MKYPREFEKAKQVAREYKAKGFMVVLEPTIDQLPTELRSLNHQPDLIAISDDTKLVIEVKSSSSIKDSRVAELACMIDEVDGWELELVYTNPKRAKSNELKQSTIDREVLVAELERVDEFVSKDISNEYWDAALLMYWRVLESSLNAVFESYNQKTKHFSVISIIRDSVTLGAIGKDDHAQIEKLNQIRNEVAHHLSRGSRTLSKVELEKFSDLIRRIFEEIPN